MTHNTKISEPGHLPANAAPFDSILDKMKRSVYNTICWNPVDSETEISTPRVNADFLPHTVVFLDYFKKCGDFLKETRSKSARRKADCQDSGYPKESGSKSTRRSLDCKKNDYPKDTRSKSARRKHESEDSRHPNERRSKSTRRNLDCQDCKYPKDTRCKSARKKLEHQENGCPQQNRRKDDCNRQKKRSAYSASNMEARVANMETMNTKREDSIWRRSEDKKKMGKNGQGEGEKKSKTQYQNNTFVTDVKSNGSLIDKSKTKHQNITFAKESNDALQDKTSTRHRVDENSFNNHIHKDTRKSIRCKQIYELSEQQCRNFKEKGYIKVNVRVKPNISVSDFDIVIRKDKIKSGHTRSRNAMN